MGLSRPLQVGRSVSEGWPESSLPWEHSFSPFPVAGSLVLTAPLCIKQETEAQKIWVNLLDDTMDELRTWGPVLLPGSHSARVLCCVLVLLSKDQLQITQAQRRKDRQSKRRARLSLGAWPSQTTFMGFSEPLRCLRTWHSRGSSSWQSQNQEEDRQMVLICPRRRRGRQGGSPLPERGAAEEAGLTGVPTDRALLGSWRGHPSCHLA